MSGVEPSAKVITGVLAVTGRKSRNRWITPAVTVDEGVGVQTAVVMTEPKTKPVQL